MIARRIEQVSWSIMDPKLTSALNLASLIDDEIQGNLSFRCLEEMMEKEKLLNNVYMQIVPVYFGATVDFR